MSFVISRIAILPVFRPDELDAAFFLDEAFFLAAAFFLDEE
jgi:hypothetical protein